jgi:hypothetical protein
MIASLDAGVRPAQREPRIMKLKIAALCALAFAAANASACYTVYDKSNRVIYQGFEAPVDMSMQLHQTLGRSHPGAQMVFDNSSVCPSVRQAVAEVPRNTIRREGAARLTPVAAPAPLLTDRRTAARLNLPHTVVQGDVVVVPAYAAANMRPGVTVIESDVVTAQAGPSTAVMGAGPAPAAKKETVITELRNPPVTIVQRGQNVSITQHGR